jgi:hypothetical protein
MRMYTKAWMLSYLCIHLVMPLLAGVNARYTDPGVCVHAYRYRYRCTDTPIHCVRQIRHARELNNTSEGYKYCTRRRTHVCRDIWSFHLINELQSSTKLRNILDPWSCTPNTPIDNCQLVVPFHHCLSLTVDSWQLTLDRWHLTYYVYASTFHIEAPSTTAPFVHFYYQYPTIKNK